MPALPEKLAYVALVNTAGDEPGALGVVDLDPSSTRFGQLIASRPAPSAPHRLGAPGRHRAALAAPRSRPRHGASQMVEVSRDGQRVYLTNGLYRAWNAQFYPEGIRGWMVKCDAAPGGGLALDPSSSCPARPASACIRSASRAAIHRLIHFVTPEDGRRGFQAHVPALAAYQWVRVAFLRRGWINLGWVWMPALLAAGPNRLAMGLR
jgi:hypothetical protein